LLAFVEIAAGDVGRNDERDGIFAVEVAERRFDASDLARP
jgi:hypothetical protein